MVRVTRQPFDPRRVPPAAHVDRVDVVTRVVGHRVEVVGVAAVGDVLDGARARRTRARRCRTAERAVVVRAHEHRAGLDVASAVVLVRRRLGRCQADAPVAERGHVRDHELDVEGRQRLEHAHPARIVGLASTRTGAPSTVYPATERRRHRQRVDVLA